MNLLPLRQRNFGLLWWAGFISMTGDWALRIALPVYVLRLTGSASAVSAVVLASLLATLLAGSVAGGYVDRWDRRRVLVLLNIVQALVLLPLVAVNSAGRVWLVVAVAAIEAGVSQFLEPAQSALLPRLVPAHQLTAANSLNSLTNYLARLTGPAIGGLVTAALGLGGAALADSGSFAVAAIFCALISGPHRAGSNGSRRTLTGELAEGLRAITGNPVARAVLAFVTITSVGEGMMRTLFAVFVIRALHAGSTQMGWLLSAQAVGGITGSVIGRRPAARCRPVALSATCMGLFGAGDLAIFNYPRLGTALWPVLVLFFLIGIAGVVGSVALLTMFQLQAPDRLRGRMFAVLAVSQAVAGMLGAAVAGALGQRVSVIDLLTAQGAGYLLAALVLRILAGSGPPPLGPAAPAAAVPATPAPAAPAPARAVPAAPAKVRAAPARPAPVSRMHAGAARSAAARIPRPWPARSSRRHGAG